MTIPKGNYNSVKIPALGIKDETGSANAGIFRCSIPKGKIATLQHTRYNIDARQKDEKVLFSAVYNHVDYVEGEPKGEAFFDQIAAPMK